MFPRAASSVLQLAVELEAVGLSRREDVPPPRRPICTPLPARRTLTQRSRLREPLGRFFLMPALAPPPLAPRGVPLARAAGDDEVE